MTSILTTLLAASAFLGAPSEPVPVILDTDLGDDIDDTWALGMLLGTPQVDLRLITTAFSDTPTKTRLVAKILERMGRTDVPIGTGVQTNGKAINQAKWLGDYDLADYKGKVLEDGVQALVDAIHASPKPVVLVVIGPQTNIAAALQKDPTIAQKASVVLMAGSVRVGYQGADKPAPEWNVVCDPKAAQAVFDAPWDITMAPLDICGTLRLNGPDYLRVEKSEAPRARVVIENYDEWVNRPHYDRDSSSILFDTAATYLSFDRSHANIEDLKLKVTDKGETVIDEAGRTVHVATTWRDEKAFKELLIGALGGLPAEAK